MGKHPLNPALACSKTRCGGYNKGGNGFPINHSVQIVSEQFSEQLNIKFREMLLENSLQLML